MDGLTSRHRSRCGATLIEVLVSISVLAILVAVAVPSVMSVREASRRLACSNSLRQIALATANDTERYDFGPDASQMPLSLGPDLETPHLEWTDPSPEIWVCPSETIETVAGFFSYVPSDGTRLFRESSTTPQAASGAIRMQPPTISIFRPVEVVDGASNTVMLAEMAGTFDEPWAWTTEQFTPAPSATDRVRYYLSGPATFDTPIETYRQLCLDGTQTQPALTSARRYHHQLHSTNGFDAIMTPNGRSCYFGTAANPGPNAAWLAILPASSDHAGGVNVALFDGSARFVSDAIAEHTWRAVCTSNGRETLSW